MQESSLSHVRNKSLSIFTNFNSRGFVQASDFFQLTRAHEEQALRKIYAVIHELSNCSGRKIPAIERGLLSHKPEREPCRSNCGLLLRLRGVDPLSGHASLLSGTGPVQVSGGGFGQRDQS